MNELVKIILSLSLSGALLILVLLLCKPLVKDKLSKRWQYYIWLIVVARLLIPLAPETNLMGMVFQYFGNTSISTDTSLQPKQEASALPETDFPNQYSVHGQVGSGSGEQLAPDKIAAPSMFEIVKQNTAVFCLLVWLIVSIGLLIRKITVYQSFVKYMKAGRIELSDMQLWERVGKLVEQAGIKGSVGLYTNSLISSPLLVGFFRPCIMLPTTELSKSDFENTVLHELTHYRRRDMFYKWLVQVTVCLHWFNPFVYIMSREVNRTCELSCDETVIKSLNKQERCAYGDTLLNAMGMGGKYKDSIACVTLSESTELLKERLDAIMKFKKPSNIIITITVILTMFFALGAFFSGIYTVAADNTDNAENIQLPKDTALNPSLTLNITSAAVTLEEAADNKISAEYNSNVYAVEISNQDNDWKVDISCKTKSNTNTEIIKLFIPNVSYSSINMNIDSAYLASSIIKSGNIIGNFNTASVLLTLPKGFNGSLDAAVTSGYFELVSKDDFSNTNATIIDKGEIGEVYAPKYFIKNGDTFTFTNGTQNNVIKVTRKGTGVIGIYSSDYSDSVDSPSDWQSEWESSWQGEWRKSWNNAWHTGNNMISNSADHVTVSFNGISVMGQGPVGVELVKSKNSNVTFELLNIEKENTCTTDAKIVNGIMQITVNHHAPNGINVDFGPEYKNVVRVYIPDALYTQFDIEATEMAVQMQDFHAPVHVESSRAGFWLIDDIVSQGTYNIKVSSAPIYIEADTILKDITANADSGPITVRFGKAPANLYLDTANCGPIVERPDGWPAIYKIGSETPKIILSNNGKAAIEVRNHSITNK